jgi:hypothetical protein
MVGAAALLPFAVKLDAGAAPALSLLLALSAAVHLLLVSGEVTLAHPTAHAKLAIHEMVYGRFAWPFWGGAVLVLPAVASPWIGVAAAPLALVGLLAYEHAYVQAGQAVPLA